MIIEYATENIFLLLVSYISILDICIICVKYSYIKYIRSFTEKKIILKYNTKKARNIDFNDPTFIIN